MDTFLKTILILLLVYYGLKILFTYFKPQIMRFIASKVQQRMEKAFHGGQQPQQQREGEVSFDTPTPKREKTKSTVGEYVDYEEID